MKITLKLPDELVKNIRHALYSRDTVQKALDQAIAAGADITAAPMQEYLALVIQTKDYVQEMWDAIFPLAAENGYVEEGATPITLGPAYRTVIFEVPDPAPETPAESGEVQNE